MDSLNPLIRCQLTSSHFTGMLDAMIFQKHNFSRREFLKLAGIGMGALAMGPLTSHWNGSSAAMRLTLADFPKADLLGRNCTSDTSLQWGGTVPIHDASERYQQQGA